jgi:sigma-B regulation protein RsbU (phosphoserine phosphatase)
MSLGTIGNTIKHIATGFGLRGTLVRRVGSVVLVIFIAIAWLSYAQASTSLQQQAEQTGRAQAAASAKQIDGVVQTILARSRQIADVAAVQGLSITQLRAYLRDLLPQIPGNQAYDNYVFFENKDYHAKDSQVWYTRAGWPNLTYATYNYHDPSQTWYALPKQTHQPSITEPFFDDGGSNVNMFSVTAPVLQGSTFLGVAGIDVGLAPFAQMTGALHFSSQGKAALDSYAFLFTGQGNLIAYPDARALVGKGQNGQPLRAVAGGVESGYEVHH